MTLTLPEDELSDSCLFWGGLAHVLSPAEPLPSSPAERLTFVFLYFSIVNELYQIFSTYYL
jgi:hypothetical protein